MEKILMIGFVMAVCGINNWLSTFNAKHAENASYLMSVMEFIVGMMFILLASFGG